MASAIVATVIGMGVGFLVWFAFYLWGLRTPKVLPPKPEEPDVRCPVEVCRIKGPHSHVDALVERLRKESACEQCARVARGKAVYCMKHGKSRPVVHRG